MDMNINDASTKLNNLEKCKNRSLKLCGHHELILTPKLACVLQTMLIELMAHEISLSNRANLSHSELTEMHFTSYGMNEHKTCTACVLK